MRELTVQAQFVKEQLTFIGDDTAMPNLLLSVMGAFAELERQLGKERQREGITLAKQRGAYRGPQASPHRGPRDQPASAGGRGRTKTPWPVTSASAAKPSTTACAAIHDSERPVDHR